MTLVNRVSAFFLAALAIALIGYSAVFYFLMRDYLNREFDDKLRNALHILAASVEVEPDDAKWHPAEHGIDLGERTLSDVIWIVCDERNQVVDRSPQVKRSDPIYQDIINNASQKESNEEATVELGQWRVLQKEMAAPRPKPVSEREPHEYASLRVTVARSQADLLLAVRRVALLVCVLPAMVWLIAAAGGRWFVRHALSPVRDMAKSARSVTHADFGLRLPTGPSHDELYELGTAFNRLLDQLQTAFDGQRRFTGDAAHQLRNPLAVLQGHLEVTRRRKRSAEEYERTLDVLIVQTTELRQIVESLLFLARSEGDKTFAKSEVVALDGWLPHFVSRFEAHPRRSDLKIQCESETYVMASLPLLSQLLENLLSNAFKYSDEGTQVVLNAKRNKDRVTIEIQDAGTGISPSDQKLIFDPFFRSEQARRDGYPGIGLGLSVADRIAQVLNSELKCESTPGEGSTFTLSLPRVEPSVVAVGHKSASAQAV
jgi:signal transduction histidine kinase